MALVRYCGGIEVSLSNKIILLDPVKKPCSKPDVIFVSHAHRDHYNISVLNRLRNIPLVVSRETYEFLKSKGLKHKNVVIPEEDYVEVNGVSFELHDANHILGSREVLINGEVAYTGDICFERRNMFKPPKVLKANTLIIEATYGSRLYIFPQRKLLYKWVLKKVINDYYEKDKAVVYARSPGVAQELLKLFSKLRVDIYLYKTVYEHTKLYMENGFKFENIKVVDSESSNGIFIYPIWYGKNDDGNGIFVTGWAAVEKDERFIPLSSHSGLNTLLSYVHNSSPEKVYTVYGFAREFASILKGLGYEASCIWI
ncbi:MAG: MBL fold metallo-hydrolase [Thermoproteales archaeon]|nr:MBL fold metallo-hydrolase [Thermoproteales archaeon]